MDRAIVLSLLLLVGLTWLLYRLTVKLEPRERPPPGPSDGEANPVVSNSRRKPIHQRLRK